MIGKCHRKCIICVSKTGCGFRIEEFDKEVSKNTLFKNFNTFSLTFFLKMPYIISVPAGTIDARPAEQCVRHFFCKAPTLCYSAIGGFTELPNG